MVNKIGAQTVFFQTEPSEFSSGQRPENLSCLREKERKILKRLFLPQVSRERLIAGNTFLLPLQHFSFGLSLLVVARSRKSS